MAQSPVYSTILKILVQLYVKAIFLLRQLTLNVREPTCSSEGYANGIIAESESVGEALQRWSWRVRKRIGRIASGNSHYHGTHRQT